MKSQGSKAPGVKSSLKACAKFLEWLRVQALGFRVEGFGKALSKTKQSSRSYDNPPPPLWPYDFQGGVRLHVTTPCPSVMTAATIQVKTSVLLFKKLNGCPSKKHRTPTSFERLRCQKTPTLLVIRTIIGNK